MSTAHYSQSLRCVNTQQYEAFGIFLKMADVIMCEFRIWDKARLLPSWHDTDTQLDRQEHFWHTLLEESTQYERRERWSRGEGVCVRTCMRVLPTASSTSFRCPEVSLVILSSI